MAGRKHASDADRTGQRSAHDKAVQLLARREYSELELRTRLERDGFAADEMDTALTALIEAGYVSDVRFGEMLVRSRVRGGYGPARLRAELRTHALSDALIQQLIDAAGVEWSELAQQQLQRRYGDKPVADRRDRARRMQFLMRRGFDGETTRSAMQAFDET